MLKRNSFKLLLVLMVLFAFVSISYGNVYRFDFTDGKAIKSYSGNGKSPDRYNAVLPDTVYSKEKGFGWLSDTEIKNLYFHPANVNPRSLHSQYFGVFPLMKGLYSSEPASFRIDMPNGRYKIFLVTGFHGV